MLIDTHAHLNLPAFEDDRGEVIKKCLESDIWMINVGTQYDNSKKAVEIAEGYKDGVFAAVGLHPSHLEKQKADGLEFEKLGGLKVPAEEFDRLKYKRLTESEKVVAIGEIGLDYYYKPKTKRKQAIFKQRQKETLLEQIDLARELDLPIIFHCRVAHKDLIEILASNNLAREIRGVIHGFVGTEDDMKEYLNMGFYIGFNGIIFKEIQGIDFYKNIGTIPLDRMLVETDCPYLSPNVFEKQRNDPFSVRDVVNRIAEIRNLNVDELSKITVENAKRLFGL